MPHDSHPGPPRIARLLLWGAVVVGSLPRIDAVSRRFPSDRDEHSDVRRYYVSMAESALAGKGWIPSYPTNFIPPPGQAFFVFAFRRLWPTSDYQHLRSVQAVASILTILLAYRIAARLHDRWAGVACAWLVALNYPLAEQVGTLLPETNYVLLLFAFVAVLFRALDAGRPGPFILAGVLLGAACLFKPLPSLLAAIMGVRLAVTGRRTSGWKRGAALIAGFLLAIAPWTLRNLWHYGCFYPIATNGGTLLALSNSLGLDSGSPEMRYWDDLYRLDYYRSPEIEAAFAGSTDADGKPEENLKDRAYLHRALSYMVSHPAHFARNYGHKLANFVLYPTYSPPPFPPPPPLFREIPGLVSFVLGAGGAGCVLLLVIKRAEPPAQALLVLILYFLLFGALFHLTRDGRMNLPFRTLLAIPASFTLVWTVQLVARLFISAATADQAA